MRNTFFTFTTILLLFCGLGCPEGPAPIDPQDSPFDNPQENTHSDATDGGASIPPATTDAGPPITSPSTDAGNVGVPPVSPDAGNLERNDAGNLQISDDGTCSGHFDISTQAELLKITECIIITGDLTFEQTALININGLENLVMSF